MSYGIEVNVEVAKDRKEWKRMHPSNPAKPYTWETRAEAEHNLYLCYGKNPDFARVVEVPEPKG